MSTPTNEPPAEQVAAPTVSTAPSGGTTDAPHTSWWHWNALPHHLGRARTSTVILSVLFLAVFALYLNVRPDTPTDPTPAGGSSDVQVPTNPLVPTAPTTTEPTEEPSPTTEPEETEAPSEDTGSPTTSSPDTGTTEPTTEPTTTPSDPTATSEPSETTSPTTEPSTSSPSPTG